MRVTSVAPDLSSASARVSETVSTAILSGTNGFVSSMPAMGLSAELQLGGRKGVAAVDRALLEAGVEPAHALVGRAVGEAVRDHGAARLTLQPVVADRRGGFQRRLDVSRIEERFLLLLPVRPHAGQAIGLQLDLHLQAVGVALRQPVLHLLHLGQDAEQVLDVVPVLMGDHVGLGELTGLALAPAEAALEFAEERRVEIDLPVGRTIERPHRRPREAARRLDPTAEQHQMRRLITAARFLKNFPPAVLVLAQHLAHEIAGGVLGLAGLRRRPVLDRRPTRLLVRRMTREDFAAADQQARIDAERPAEKAEYPEPANAQSAGPHRHAEAAATVTAAALVATVFDVVAGLPIVGAHRRSSLGREHIPFFRGRAMLSVLRGATFFSADRYPPRIKSAAGLRRKRANLHIVSKRFTRHGAQSFR